MNLIALLSPVALIEICRKSLTKGQIGTVVEFLRREGEEALLVEFSDETGRTYAMVDLKPDQLLAFASKD